LIGVFTMSKWTKNCPLCNELQKYTTEKILKVAIKNNRICKKCNPGFVGAGSKNGMYGKNHSDDTKKKIAENTKKHMLNVPKSEEQKKKISMSLRGKKLSSSHIEKLKKPKSEEHKQKLRKPKSEESKKKMRVSARKRLLKGLGPIAVPNYNPRACLEIDKLGNNLGYKFQHAMSQDGEFFIEELFYWVDGYDKEQNVVVEYDELHHNWSRYKERDIIRQTEIIELLKCKFIRLVEQKDGTIQVKHIN